MMNLRIATALFKLVIGASLGVPGEVDPNRSRDRLVRIETRLHELEAKDLELKESRRRITEMIAEMGHNVRIETETGDVIAARWEELTRRIAQSMRSHESDERMALWWASYQLGDELMAQRAKTLRLHRELQALRARQGELQEEIDELERGRIRLTREYGSILQETLLIASFEPPAPRVAAE